jgi:hypothetical protein
MEIEELLEWHRENAAELKGEQGEGESLVFHCLAVALLEEVISEPIWKAEITSKMVETWKDEAKENLVESLNAAVQMTCEQVAQEYEEEEITD